MDLLRAFFYFPIYFEEKYAVIVPNLERIWLETLVMESKMTSGGFHTVFSFLIASWWRRVP